MNNSYAICRYKLLAYVFVLSLFCTPAFASHIVGGEMSYKYLGNTSLGSRYEVSLTIYQDCLNPLPGAIEGDNPAFLSVFDVTGFARIRTDSVTYASSESVPANFSNDCITNAPKLCLIKKTFVINYTLPFNGHGYIVAYQRCCRNESIVNIKQPGNTGSTYYCLLPPSSRPNNSAVFKNYPPQIICLNNPLFYDQSAYDPDGDSLSYEFCNALTGGEGSFTDPAPKPPPYDSVRWIGPVFSYNKPLPGYPPITIDPATGLISGTPNRMGRYLVTICCHEWRGGRIINTIKREFQFVVTDCSKSVVACIPQFSSDFNTYIVECKKLAVHFVNCSEGGKTWHWDFGVPGSNTDTSTLKEPDFTYPDTGTYKVTLIVNINATCTDSITRLVKVYPKFHSDFNYTGRFCPGEGVQFEDISTATIQPITGWWWSFGDGKTDYEQNPVHNYQYGGTYNVLLAAQNIKGCTDTTLREIIINNFRPFAGNDTTIVKGEVLRFNAVGGTDYQWSPTYTLSDSTSNSPISYYADTGSYQYQVKVTSAYGCVGYDSLTVTVVNQASFFVPNAFSPNGDGRNDFFRPRAIGYKELAYFRVVNRWGEVVYEGNTLETGWDGSYKSEIADVGTYFWEMAFTDRFGKKGYLKGDVQLIR